RALLHDARRARLPRQERRLRGGHGPECRRRGRGDRPHAHEHDGTKRRLRLHLRPEGADGGRRPAGLEDHEDRAIITDSLAVPMLEMPRLPTSILVALCAITSLVLLGWTTLAIHSSPLGPEWLRSALTVLVPVGGVAALVLVRPRRWAVAAVAGAFVVVL